MKKPMGEITTHTKGQALKRNKRGKIRNQKGAFGKKG